MAGAPVRQGAAAGPIPVQVVFAVDRLAGVSGARDVLERRPRLLAYLVFDGDHFDASRLYLHHREHVHRGHQELAAVHDHKLRVLVADQLRRLRVVHATGGEIEQNPHRPVFS
jgi:hypothetical protein